MRDASTETGTVLSDGGARASAGARRRDQSGEASGPAPRDGDGSLVEHAMRSVTEYIQANGMLAGDTLPSEKFFSDYLNVSRTVMREAFRSLAALCVIDVANGRRARVCAMDSRVLATLLNHAVGTAQISIAEIWEVRRTIEAKTASRAARLRTQDEAHALMRLADDIGDSTDDLDRVIRLDIDFHQAIASASQNALFEQLVSSFEPLMQLVARVAWRTRTTKSQKRDSVRIHQAIAKAIFKQDADGAAQAMELHFDYAVESVLHRVTAFPTNAVTELLSIPR
jgi:GntR family transcriptional repressor for pyruvate dehydrogenase complex